MRRPRTPRERAEKMGRLFGVAATALAVAAVTQKLAQAEKIAADLRADNERLRADNDAEKMRMRVEFEEKLTQERAQHQNALTDLRADNERQRVLAQDEKRIADEKIAELQRERDRARFMEKAERDRAEHWYQAKVTLGQKLDEEIEEADRLSSQNQTLREQLDETVAQTQRLAAQVKKAQQAISDGHSAYQALRQKHNALVGRFNRFVTTAHASLRSDYGDLQKLLDMQVEDCDALTRRFNTLAQTTEDIRRKHNALVVENRGLRQSLSHPSVAWGSYSQLTAENQRLRFESDGLKQQLTEKSGAVVRLESLVNQQRQQLAAGQFSQELPETRTRGRGRSGEPRRKDSEEQQFQLEQPEESSSIWGNLLKFGAGVALGGVGVAAGLKAMGAGGGGDVTLSSSSTANRRRLTGKVPSD